MSAHDELIDLAENSSEGLDHPDFWGALGCSGVECVSGRLGLSSGTSKIGNTGALFLASGVATAGRGGMMTVSVGRGESGSSGALSDLSGRTVNTRVRGWRAECGDWRDCYPNYQLR